MFFFQSTNSCLLVQSGNWTSQSIKKLSTGGYVRFQRWMRPPGTGSTRSNSPVYPSSHVLRHPAQTWACTAAFFTDPRVQRPAGCWPSGSWRRSLVAVEATPRSLHHRTLMFAGLKIAASTHIMQQRSDGYACYKVQTLLRRSLQRCCSLLLSDTCNWSFSLQIYRIGPCLT